MLHKDLLYCAVVQRYEDYLSVQREREKKSRAHHCGRLRQEKNSIHLIKVKHKYVVTNKKKVSRGKMAILTDGHLRFLINLLGFNIDEKHGI